MESERLSKIVDAKYAPADLVKIADEQKHLSKGEQQELYQLLNKHNQLFDGTLDKWKGKPIHIQLKEGATPYHAKPYAVPKACERKLKIEVDRLVKKGVLKKVYCSEWEAPSFAIPKKDQTICFINDFES